MTEAEALPQGRFAARMSVFWLIVALVVAEIAIASVALGPVSAMKTEGVGAELASALVLFAAFLIYSADRIGSGKLGFWHIALLLVVMALRELDLDKRLFTDGMLKLRFYTGAEVPLYEKVIGGTIILAILAALWRLLRRDVGPWWAALRERRAWAWIVFGAIAAAVISKTLDGAGRKLEPFGITLGADLDLALGVFEEILELVFALALVLALCLIPKSRVHRSGDALSVRDTAEQGGAS